jgi:hypothetical protein
LQPVGLRLSSRSTNQVNRRLRSRRVTNAPERSIIE